MTTRTRRVLSLILRGTGAVLVSAGPILGAFAVYSFGTAEEAGLLRPGSSMWSTAPWEGMLTDAGLLLGAGIVALLAGSAQARRAVTPRPFVPDTLRGLRPGA